MDKTNKRTGSSQVIGAGRRSTHWVMLFALLVTFVTIPAATATAYERPVIIRFEGAITPMREQYLLRKLETAKRYRADLLIIEIDSPGGYVEESVRLAEKLQFIDWAKTVAFIPREAISGAAFISLGCDEIVMAPGARLGDAGPIFLGPDAAFRHAPEKIRSYLVRVVRDLCEAKGRPPALGEAMVDNTAVVWRVRNVATGEETFRTESELKAEVEPVEWEKIAPLDESREGLFLTLNGERSVEFALAEGLAADRTELQQRYELEQSPRVLEATTIDTIVWVLNWWLVSGLLIAVGLLALYVELSAPGISIGAVVSVLCFALFFWARFLGGTSGWLEVILFAGGVACIALEIFVIPGLGVSGVLGLLLIFSSVVFASQNFWIPNSYREIGVVSSGMLMALAASIVFLVGAVVITRYFGSLPLLNRLVLKPPVAQSEFLPAPLEKSEIDFSTPKVAEPFSVGDWGVAISALRPAGKIEINDEFVDVISEGAFIEAGSQVAIIKITGNQVVVRATDAAADNG